MRWSDNPAVKRWVLIIVIVVVAFWLFNALVSSPSDAAMVWSP